MEKGEYRAEKALVLSDVVEQSFKVLDTVVCGQGQGLPTDRQSTSGASRLKDLKREVFFEYAEMTQAREVKASTINHTFAYMRTLLKFAETYMQPQARDGRV